MVLFNILVSSLTQSIDQCLHPEDSLIEANLYFEILSFVCGIFISILGAFRIIIYHTVILKLNLKGKEKFIQKAMNSSKKQRDKDFMHVELKTDELDSPESIEAFSYKESKKGFNFTEI